LKRNHLTMSCDLQQQFDCHPDAEKQSRRPLVENLQQYKGVLILNLLCSTERLP
jgi:hypothetical protein